MIPIPPLTANSIWRSGKNKIYLNPKYKTWQKEAAWTAINNKIGLGAKEHYSLSIKAGRPDKRRRDIDNIIKPISDLLVAVQYVADDYLCNKVTAEWSDEVEKGMVKIIIEDWSE